MCYFNVVVSSLSDSRVCKKSLKKKRSCYSFYFESRPSELRCFFLFPVFLPWEGGPPPWGEKHRPDSGVRLDNCGKFLNTFRRLLNKLPEPALGWWIAIEVGGGFLRCLSRELKLGKCGVKMESPAEWEGGRVGWGGWIWQELLLTG